MIKRTRKYPFIKTLDLCPSVQERLARSLDRIVAGSDHVVETPLARNSNVQTIVAEWDEIFNSKRDDVNEVLYSIEQTQRSSLGPRSIAKPWEERKSELHTYFDSESTGAQRVPISIKGPRSGLRPIAFSSAIPDLKNNTNSGLPYFVQKSDVKDIYMRDFHHLVDRRDPCVLFTRTQEGGKTRNVWGYPMADTIAEMRYYKPLLSYQRRLPWRSALVGPPAIDDAMSRLLTLAKVNNYKCISIDFSKYDTSIKQTLQKYSFDYIKGLFQPSFAQEIDELFERFNSIGIVTPEGILDGPHGVPSGSTFTNEVDSIAQYLLVRDFLKTDEFMDIQGDDGAYCMDIASYDALKARVREFGLHLNEEKSYVSDDYYVYLQNLYHSDYMLDGKVSGIYPIYRALNRLLYMERFSDIADAGMSGQDYFSIRAIAILENCKNHPLFEDFVKFIATNDRYKLSYSRQGLMNYIGSNFEATRSTVEFQNQYGDDLNGIDSFETVKLLRTLV